jgi:hypothetical protein
LKRAPHSTIRNFSIALVVLLRFENIDVVKKFYDEGQTDLENGVGRKYADIYTYSIEGIEQK